MKQLTVMVLIAVWATGVAAQDGKGILQCSTGDWYVQVEETKTVRQRFVDLLQDSRIAFAFKRWDQKAGVPVEYVKVVITDVAGKEKEFTLHVEPSVASNSVRVVSGAIMEVEVKAGKGLTKGAYGIAEGCLGVGIGGKGE